MPDDPTAPTAERPTPALAPLPAPPSLAVAQRISPPWDRAMSRAVQTEPGAAVILVARRCRDGRTAGTSSRRSGGMPDPSSSTCLVKALVARRLDKNMLGVALRIADEIGKASLERIGSKRHDRIEKRSWRQIQPARRRGANLQEFCDVDFSRALSGVTPRKSEIGLSMRCISSMSFCRSRVSWSRSSRRATA